jgi:hypothetical protein
MSGTFFVSSARNLVRPSGGERIFFNTAGIISWTVPAGVTSISIVVVGGGGGGGGSAYNFTTSIISTGGAGGGGGLAYVTDIAVTPGEILEINAGFGGNGGSNFITGSPGINIGSAVTAGAAGGSSWVRRQGSGTFIVSATGGNGGAPGAFLAQGGTGGARVIGEGGGRGGDGGSGSLNNNVQKTGAGGGGAGGYDGAGGLGEGSRQTSLNSQQGAVGFGGAGAGGNSVAGTIQTQSGGYGGGVGIYGQRLDGSPPTATNSPVTATGPGSTINISNAVTSGSITTVSAITYSPLGISGLASSTSNAGDDNFWTVSLPWNVNFLGTSYSQVFVGTNSYITFGSGSSAFSGLGGNVPAFPKIMVSAADNSGQRIYFGTVGTAPNRIYVIIFEGTASASGTLGSPNMVVEYQFYEATPNQIDFHIVQNARGASGTSGVFNATGSEAYGIAISGGSANRLSSSTGPFSFTPAVINNEYLYVGGGAGAYSYGNVTGVTPLSANQGRYGAVRIVWPGNQRRFPDLNVAPGFVYVPLIAPGPPRLRSTGTQNPDATTIVILYDTPNTGGLIVTSYYTTQLPSGPTITLEQSGAGEFTFTGLTAGTYYDFDVYAVNTIGTSSPLQLRNIPAGSVPPTISVVNVSIASTSSLVVNWTNPTNTSGWPITSWRVRLLLLDVGVPPGSYSTTPASTVDVTLPNSGAPITTYTATSLAQGRTYNVQVLSTNFIGTGTFSNDLFVAPAVAPNVPTIGTATSVNATTASVSFTAPANNGGSVITSYTAVSSPGGITGTLSGSGSGSITVTGLTALSSYTFTVYATNAAGNSASSGASNSVQVVAPPGQVEFTTAGNYNWTVPEGVTSISIVLVGAGGTPNGYYGGGGGGGLTYKNNLSVTAGTVYPIQVARIGVSNTPEDLPPSFFNSETYLFAASGGRGTVTTFGGYPGGGGGAAGYSGNGGPGIFAGAGSLFGTGGAGGGGGGTVGGQVSWSGGSGAPHYGGAFATYGNGFTGSGGAGGGGGAGGAGPGGGGAGGGVGIYGEGASGTGGASSGSATTAGQPGNPGSNGVGKLYGGGAGGPGSPALWQPGGGAVRIIWPGNLRLFPSTRTANE